MSTDPTLIDAFSDLNFGGLEDQSGVLVTPELEPKLSECAEIELNPILANIPEELRADPLLTDAEYLDICESGRIAGSDIDRILKILGRNGGYSDLIVASDQYIYRKKDKRLMPLFVNKITADEVKDIVEYMFDAEQASSAFAPDSDIDATYEHQYDRAKSPMRARVNVCSFQNGPQRTLKMTLRDIQPIPPSFDELNTHPLIRQYASGKDGLIAIAGSTGSGKTTTCASIIRYLKEDTEHHRVILTYEKPIEFNFKHVRGPNLVFQHTIGRFGDFTSFYSGLVNALRNTPEVILVGESRDKETFETLPKIAESGHLGITTLHARSITNIFTRIANEIGADRAEGVVRQTIEYMRLAVYQELVKTQDGKMVCLVEILPFTREVKDEILKQPYENFNSTIERLIDKHGVSLKTSAKKALDEQRISEREYRSVIN